MVVVGRQSRVKKFVDSVRMVVLRSLLGDEEEDAGDVADAR